MGVSVESKRVSYVVCSKGLRRNIVTADLKYDSHPEINENRGGEKLGKRESRKGGEGVAGWRGGVGGGGGGGGGGREESAQASGAKEDDVSANG